jgi:hypothetical protein
MFSFTHDHADSDLDLADFRPSEGDSATERECVKVNA